MTRLEDLLYSLTTVLIRYHDYQKHVDKEASDGTDSLEAKESSRDRAKSIIMDTHFKMKLNSLIINSTNHGYSQRKHFLNYLYKEIVFLKEITDSNHPIDELSLEEYKDRVTLLFKNIRTLLGIVKSKTGQIELQDTDDQGFAKRAPKPDNTIIHKTIALSGLINDDYFGGGYYCRSAELIDQEVLSRVNMGIYFDGSHHIPRCTDEAISQFVTDSFSEHLNVILVAQLSSESLRQKETIKQLEEINSQQVACLYQASTTVRELQSQNKEYEEKIKLLEEQKEKLSHLCTGTTAPTLSKARLMATHGVLWTGLSTGSRILDNSIAPAESSSSGRSTTSRK